MPFHRHLANGIAIVQTRLEHADALAGLQVAVFPTLASAERFGAEHYRRHVERFPEGQFVALDDHRVVGMTTTLRADESTAFGEHAFADIIGAGFLDAHDPTGTWLYGADIGTHPDWRGRGIARALYAARHETARVLGLKGQATVGMLNGFSTRGDGSSLESYYEAVVSGGRWDPTVSVQMRLGFEARGLIRNYVHDPTCGNAGVRLVLPVNRGIDVEWASGP